MLTPNSARIHRRLPPSSRLLRIVIQYFLLGLILIAVGTLHYQQTARMSHQSRANIAAAEKPTLVAAVDEYPSAWPPAYPVSLWLFARFGAPVQLFNLLCFYALLLSVWGFARTHLSTISPVIVVFFVASIHANYHNVHQQTAETLFALLAVVALLVLASFKQHSTHLLVCVLGVLTALSALTRFFALFWIAPLMLLHLAFLEPNRSMRRRAAQVCVYVAPIMLFVVPWLLRLRGQTGAFSGADRFATRIYPPALAHWENLTGFTSNVKLAIKTAFVDTFSPQRLASHKVVDTQGLTVSEVFIAVLLAIALALVIGVVVITFRNLPPAAKRAAISHAANSPSLLPAHFAVVYVISLVVTWTLSNNDPIYTRFMFPSYVFFVLAAFAIFSWTKSRCKDRWHILPWHLLGALYLGSNLLNMASSLALL